MLRSNRVLSVLAVLGLACSPSMPVAAATVIRLGTIAPEQSVWHDALLRIRQDWRDITKGEVELRIYAGGVLGGEDEMVRKVQRRTLERCLFIASFRRGLLSCGITVVSLSSPGQYPDPVYPDSSAFGE